MSEAPDPSLVRRVPWWRSPALIVTAVATVYACVVTFPLIFQLDESIYGYPGDATGSVAVFEFWTNALRHHTSIFDNQLWGAPYGAGWQAVPFTAISVLVLAPLAGLLGGTTAYNVEVLSSFPLIAWTTYLLARRLGCRPLAAGFSALAFAFMPYHLEKAQGHAGQTHMEFFSATLLFLVRWRQGGSKWNLAAAGAMAGLMLWNDYYFAFISAFLVATFFVVSYLHRRWRQPDAPSFRRHLVAAIVVAVVTALFVPVTVLVADRPSGGSVTGSLNTQALNFHQSLLELETYSSRPWEFVLPYHANPLVPPALVRFEVAHLHGSNFTEQSLFLGYTVMALALIAVFAARNRFETMLLLALGFVGAVISLPPGIHFHGIVIPTPSLALNAVFQIFRVYARFGILTLLGAALLAGLGLTAVQNRLNGRHAWLLAIPFVLAAIEFNNRGLFTISYWRTSLRKSTGCKTLLRPM